MEQQPNCTSWLPGRTWEPQLTLLADYLFSPSRIDTQCYSLWLFIVIWCYLILPSTPILFPTAAIYWCPLLLIIFSHCYLLRFAFDICNYLLRLLLLLTLRAAIHVLLLTVFVYQHLLLPFTATLC